jgi:LuxR family maltose regulon positive regulatory protein
MRGLVEIYLGLMRQIIGGTDIALEAIRDEIQISESLGGALHSRVVLGQALVHTVAGQLAPAAELARLVEIITEKAGITYMAGWGRYLQGASALRSHDLEAAIRHFTPARADPHVMHTRSAVDGLVGLAIAQQAIGKPDMAAETMSHLSAFARETRESEHMAIARSGRARLALAQDDIEAAVRWEHAFDGEGHAPTMLIWLENPMITQIRVLIEVGSTESLQKASHRLHRLRHELELLHNTSQLIDIGALQSLALNRQGRTNDALAALDQTITIAEPGGWIWPFVEAGPPMISLLERLVEQSSDGSTYARQLLATCRPVPR